MERFDGDLVLTTSQAADLLDVHPSTVKRWCDGDELDPDKTRGGHRRIHLDDALELARERGISTFLDPFAPYQPHVWNAFRAIVDDGSFHRMHSLARGWLSCGHTKRIGWLFQAFGRRPEISFPLFCDEGVGGFMERVGEAWKEGRLRVGEEHLARQTVLEALLHLRPSGRVEHSEPSAGTGSGRLAIVGSVEGDRDHLGALCARLLLERHGWSTLYLGANVPLEDFATLQRTRGADLVCVSVSPPGTDAQVSHCIRVLADLYSPGDPYALAIGGRGAGASTAGAFPAPFDDVRLFGSSRELDGALRAGFGLPRARGVAV